MNLKEFAKLYTQSTETLREPLNIYEGDFDNTTFLGRWARIATVALDTCISPAVVSEVQYDDNLSPEDRILFKRELPTLLHNWLPSSGYAIVPQSTCEENRLHLKVDFINHLFDVGRLDVVLQYVPNLEDVPHWSLYVDKMMDRYYEKLYQHLRITQDTEDCRVGIEIIDEQV